MNRLAIDTAGAACQVTVARSGADPVRRVAEMQRGHAEALMPMVAEALAAASLSVRDVGQIVVTTGPGSFTGVRIGLAAVAGLIAGRPVRVVGVSLFEALRITVADARPDLAARPLLVAVDSRRRDVFFQLYSADGVAEGEAASADPAELAADLPAGCVLAGDGAAAVAAKASETSGVEESGLILPDLAAVLAAIPLDAGVSDSGVLPEPLYIRPPDVTLPGK
ncbi:MAG: tRNA (adenosine(37)-N6)-threonylcarbamoyltransferase complex dimerization subunit type 1 TsaB [Alphaproteobacteria bacterium]|nr:tRNA (adenosine(37)-N6)-threonylcarbamoyltransferase complex dimerization subunit type 1 TsaB [Alphaproteobacteria bacterium]